MTDTTPDVRPGQVWADNDKRSEGRHVKVVELISADPDKAQPPKAKVVRCNSHGGALHPLRYSIIRISRFRPTHTGYRLVKDVTP